MVGDVLTLAGGDDGSGFDYHWRGWSASVDGLDEAVIEEEKRRVADGGRMIGTVALIGEANDPLRAMAEKQMRQALGGLGIGMISMS